MYVIMKAGAEEFEDRFYAGHWCGCIIWKRHVPTAVLFECISDAFEDAFTVAGMSVDDFIVVDLDEMENVK